MPALFLTVFIDLVGFGIAIPLLPFYAQRFGASPDIVTLVIATYSLTQLAATPLWGRLSDRIGRRPVMIISLAGTIVGYLWLAATDSLLMLFLARGFSGAMAGNTAVAQAYVADVTAPEDRARGHGRMGAAHGLGFLAGPAIGGLLAGSDPANATFYVPFLCAAGLSAVALMLAVFRLPESVPAAGRVPAGAARRFGWGSVVEVLRRPQLGLLVGIMFMMPFVFAGVETTLALWTERAYGWGPLENGYLYSYMGLVAVIVQGGLVGPLSRRFGERRLVRTGAVLVGAGMATLPLTGDVAGLMASLAGLVVGVCITGPSMSSLISRRAGAGERGAVLGIAYSSGGLARIVGPAWAGWGFVTFGRDSPYLAGAAVMALMLLLSLRIANPPGQEEEGANTPDSAG